MGSIMRQLGWTRPEHTIRFEGGTARGYIKGAAEDEILVHPDPQVRGFFCISLGGPPNVKDSREIAGGIMVHNGLETMF
jgi:hypothetical protein